MTEHAVFFLSDGTGITAQALGQSLMAQFEKINFQAETIPYIDTEEKAEKVVERINTVFKQKKIKPILFATFATDSIRNIIAKSQGELFDLIHAFTAKLENLLESPASQFMGRNRAVSDYKRYELRMDAIHFSLQTDDGLHCEAYEAADLILLGVSRCGKTPTSLYLSLQFGVFAANYPLTEEDMHGDISLPSVLLPYRHKLFGLTINLDRLMAIRAERKPNSRYAERGYCQTELTFAEKLFQKEKIAYLNSTHLSIEELATRIMNQIGIQNRY